MAFIPRRSGVLGRASTQPVLAVGRRVFVNCVGQPLGSIALTDENGNALPRRVTDGSEVEILAWRPRGSVGTRYRVRVDSDGAAGWLHAVNLRLAQVAPPASEQPGPGAAGEPADRPRPFGQRR